MEYNEKVSFPIFFIFLVYVLWLRMYVTLVAVTHVAHVREVGGGVRRCLNLDLCLLLLLTVDENLIILLRLRVSANNFEPQI
jgi:hypothetical protein